MNGNVGTGVAVAGAFSLVRFRSVPGSAKEICTLFLAMGAGLITGMGYLGFAVLFTLVMCAMFMLYNHIDFGAKRIPIPIKFFSITIPEDLNYSSIWDDIFEEYTVSHDLICVKKHQYGQYVQTDLQYPLRNPEREKEMIDKFRCRNGNLEITVSKRETATAEL